MSLVGIIVIGLAGRAGWAYWQVYQAEQAMKIFQTSLQQSMQATSFSFVATTTGQVSIKPQDGIPPSFDFSIVSSGEMDVHSLENPMFDIMANINITSKTATSSGSLTLGAREILLQKNAYLNLKNFNVVYNSTDPKQSGVQMILGIVNGVANSIANKWIQVDTSKYIATTTVQSASIYNDQRLKDYLSARSYITALTMVGKETLSGLPVYHVKVSIEHGQQLVDIIRQITLEKNPDAAKDMNAFNKDMEDISKIISQKIDVDLWIGQDDSFVHKVVTSPFVVRDEKSETMVSVVEEIVLSGQNKPVSIVAPQDALPIETIMQNVLGGMFGGVTSSLNTARAKGSDAATKSYLANMRAQAELYYDSHGNSYAGVCSSKEFKKTKAAILSSSSRTPSCYDRTTSWAMSGELKTVPVTYWCADSRGRSAPRATPVKDATGC